jgi:hypothetical protein
MWKYVEWPVHKLDTTPPKASNMQHNYSHILADANGYLKLDIVDTGSAITATTDMELATDMSNTTSLILLSSSGTYVPVTKSYTLSWMYDYSIVDWSDRVNATASRPYTMKVTKLVDEAGNITNIPGWVSYAYNVYANTLKFNTSQLQSVITTGVADGIDIPMTLSVKDIYGNGIIPSTPINRVLSFSWIVTNNLYLDQAQRIGNTSSFITPPWSSRQSIPLWMGQSIIVSPMQAALTSVGDYTFGIRAYTPTANAYTATEPVSDPSANLQFAQVDISVTDTLAGQQLYTNILWSNKSYIFSPLYTSKIRWDLLDGWFIEWIVQNSKIDIMKNASSTRPNWLPSTPLGFSYSGTDASLFDFSVSSNNPPNIPIGSSPQILNTNPPTIPVSDYPFYSLLSQKASSILQSNSRIFLASHFQYVMDGYPITYNSDIVGKSSYFDPNIHNYGNQVWVKIIGLVASQNRKELIQWQYNQWVSVFDGIAKSQVRDALLQSVSLAVRNISKSSIGTSVTSLTSLPTGLTASWWIIRQSADRSIMYIEWNGQTIDLNMSAIDWVRTLFLKWVNLYIKQDMYYTNNKSILGVYIAKNMNNVWWNLYIDPSVTNIIWAYALEWAMQSYNGVNVLTFSNSNIATLKNQLYLYGTLLSENTLGWSRAAVPKCPSLLNIPTCTQDEAQKYDLNYIRRYYLIDPTLAGWTNAVPFAGWKIIAGWTCDKNTGNCSSFNPMLKQKFTNTSDDLAKNPFIIEYNPTIRSIQPTGFEGILQ